MLTIFKDLLESNTPVRTRVNTGEYKPTQTELDSTLVNHEWTPKEHEWTQVAGTECKENTSESRLIST